MRPVKAVGLPHRNVRNALAPAARQGLREGLSVSTFCAVYLFLSLLGLLLLAAFIAGAEQTDEDID